MKRLVIINLLLFLLLNILPNQTRVEAIANKEIIQTETITSRSLEEPRQEQTSTEIDKIEQKPTNISQDGIDLIMKYEGFRVEAYKLEGEKYYTIGYGHYGADVKKGQVITQEEAYNLLLADLKGYTELVLKKCDYLNLNQAELDALVSFTYNCGLGNLNKLTANGTRTKEEIAQKILNYTKSSSESNRKGLAKRRLAEQELFLGGV